MSIAHLTFIDIETVPAVPFEQLDPHVEDMFRSKNVAAIIDKKEYSTTAGKDVYADKAALQAEFGKIVAISIGKWIEGDKMFYVRSLTGRDEKLLLTQAAESLKKAGGTFIGHNAIEFDFPFLMRRFMINGIPIPAQLDVAETKPWDVKLRDTMKMWSGTAWNYKCSLELLCHIFGIESPKKEIGGGDIAKIYYESFNVGKDELAFDVEEAAMKKIGTYCSGDTLACAQVYSKMKGLPLIENVEYV